MKIDNIGYNYTHNESFYIHRPKGSTDYLIVLFKSDAVVDDVVVNAGSLIIYERGTPQFYKAFGEVFCNDWIHFSLAQAEADRLIEFGIVFNKPLYLGNISDLSEIIRRISSEFFSDNLQKQWTMQMYFSILMLKISERSVKNSRTQSKISRFDELRSAIYSTPSNDWNVEKLAEETALSKSRFQHLYKQIYGTTVISDIISSRIEHAKHLLLTTDISVKSIAERCGYSNDVHFVRQFKQRTGVTPGQFKRKN